jgi:electron transport complex protein RnfG
MPDTIKAPLILTTVCAVVCALLALANELTADRIAAAEEAQLRTSLTAAFGEGEYTALPEHCDGIDQIISNGNGTLIFEITASGYEKNGQHLLVGIDSDGAVSAVCIVSIKDSPTQAAAVQSDGFLGQFTGRTDPNTGYDAVSGATRSSAGIADAVGRALHAYQEYKELKPDA